MRERERASIRRKHSYIIERENHKLKIALSSWLCTTLAKECSPMESAGTSV